MLIERLKCHEDHLKVFQFSFTGLRIRVANLFFKLLTCFLYIFRVITDSVPTFATWWVLSKIVKKKQYEIRLKKKHKNKKTFSVARTVQARSRWSRFSRAFSFQLWLPAGKQNGDPGVADAHGGGVSGALDDKLGRDSMGEETAGIVGRPGCAGDGIADGSSAPRLSRLQGTSLLVTRIFVRLHLFVVVVDIFFHLACNRSLASPAVRTCAPTRVRLSRNLGITGRREKSRASRNCCINADSEITVRRRQEHLRRWFFLSLGARKVLDKRRSAIAFTAQRKQNFGFYRGLW